MSFIAPLIRPILGQAARYVYRGLRAQDRLVDYTYRKAGLYNRGVVRGVKHGLAGGQIAGGVFKLGLPGYDDAPIQKRPKTYRFRKTYRRNFKRYRSNNKYCRPKPTRRRRYVYSGR